VWKYFLENSGYFSINQPAGKEPKGSRISLNKQLQVLAFVQPILNPVDAAFLDFASEKCEEEKHPYSFNDHQCLKDIACGYNIIS
jgi:hypothetical protein